MANLQFGDVVKYLPKTTIYPTKITNVVPIMFDAFIGSWVVCEQTKATHMMITMDAVDMEDANISTNMIIEIGKCENLYLLADAIV